MYLMIMTLLLIYFLVLEHSTSSCDVTSLVSEIIIMADMIN